MIPKAAQMAVAIRDVQLAVKITSSSISSVRAVVGGFPLLGVVNIYCPAAMTMAVEGARGLID